MQLSHTLPSELRDCRAVHVLERSLQNNRLGHGILLHGESYSYLCEIAEAIAGYLLGSSKDTALSHPDCFTLRPSGRARLIKIGSESERRQGEWPQNSMRRLVNDLQKTANQGGRKVAIVYEADRMNHQSANAFLKTLEEPAADSTLFLITCRPYDLLDTIRSRCLNFKIPTETAQQIHPDWITWTQQYRDWLGQLIIGPKKGQASHLIFAAYGLNLRFQAIMSELSEKSLQEQKSTQPESLSAEEKSAIEAGIERRFRKQLLSEVEKETVLYARDIEAENPDCLPVQALNQAIKSLEKVTQLLELNFNLSAALERFFLQSLKIWTGRS